MFVVQAVALRSLASSLVLPQVPQLLSELPLMLVKNLPVAHGLLPPQMASKSQDTESQSELQLVTFHSTMLAHSETAMTFTLMWLLTAKRLTISHHL
jgi:hypothetical protein